MDARKAVRGPADEVNSIQRGKWLAMRNGNSVSTRGSAST
jgi:hypothetical protein